MNSNIFTEINRLQNEFAAQQADGGRLQLELAALLRDENELNQKMIATHQGGQDVAPVLLELRDLLLTRAELLTQCAEKDSQCAALCRQSAEAITGLATPADG